jgi:hypothetical protein
MAVVLFSLILLPRIKMIILTALNSRRPIRRRVFALTKHIPLEVLEGDHNYGNIIE